MAPDRVELHSWEWERGKASHPVYLERARIFRRFRFSLRIRFLRHFALMIKLREGLLVSFSILFFTCIQYITPDTSLKFIYNSLQSTLTKSQGC